MADTVDCQRTNILERYKQQMISLTSQPLRNDHELEEENMKDYYYLFFVEDMEEVYGSIAA